jgi:branched-chain amino acid transport system permease protein
MPGTPGWVILLIGDGGGLHCCRHLLNFTIEKLAYRPVAQFSPRLAPADHRHWYVHPAADAGHDHLEAQLQTVPNLLPSVPYEIGGAVITLTQVMILA